MSGEEEVEPLAIGDRILLQGGVRDGTRGRIYYLDDQLMRIMPDGVTDRLVDISIVDGDLDPALGVEAIYPLSRRTSPSFVEQINAYKGQKAETYSAEGEPGIVYTIEEVNPKEDTIILVDETGARKEIEFIYGIPLEEPFAVLRPQPPPADIELGKPESEEPSLETAFEDIEAPPAVEAEIGGLEEVSETMVSYPDTIQRNEMLDDLLTALPLASQRNPKLQQKIRKEVEQCMSLRNDLVLYSKAGDPVGQKSTSFQTVMEMIDRADIPLARPVLQAKRVLNLTRADENDTLTEIPGKEVQITYQDETTKAIVDFLETQLGGTSEQQVTPDALPGWYLSWETFFKQFLQTFVSEGAPGETVVFAGDKEFLRAPAPKVGDDGSLEPAVDGIVPLGKKAAAMDAEEQEVMNTELDREAERVAGDTDYLVETAEEDELEVALKQKRKGGSRNKAAVTHEDIGKIGLSLLKGLGPRSTRLKAKEAPRRIESGDEGVIINQLIFPLSSERHLGGTRSGSLMKDMAYAIAPLKTIKDVLEESGGIPEEATSGGILSIGPGGNTSGSIGIDDWLKAQPIHIKGLGDALIELRNLGLTQRELTADQQAVLVEKINQHRALLYEMIATERQRASKAKTEEGLTNQTFLQGEALEELLITLREEPLVSAYVDELRRRLPAYRENDIALFAGVSAQMADLLLVTLAGQPGPLARERNRRVRDQFVEALHRALAKSKKEEDAGELPEPINCPHVPSLTAIRKIRDDTQRMMALSKFLANFQQKRHNNWVWCAAAPEGQDHKLLCYHEVLLLEEFKHPREKDTIHKELLLHFSGGQFHGKYICKNCGQAISDLEFDASMEFDDEGRPMAGRAVMVDQDAVAQEELDLLLGTPIEETEEVKFDTEQKTIIYKTARELFDTLGLYCDMESYTRIIQRVDAELQRLPTQEQYAKKVKASAAKGVKEPEYTIYTNRILVASVGAHTLIEIQAKTPDFIVRSTIPGCRAGFTGIPFTVGSDKTGLEYVSCAIASIKAKKEPWSLTGYQQFANDQKRREIIASNLEKVVEMASKTAIVQQLFIEKRAYIERQLGETTVVAHQLLEDVGEGFRPIPYAISAEDAAKAVVVPDAASLLERTRAWIQTGHRLARKYGSFVAGSPFLETSCCFTKIVDPRGFWVEQAASLPALPPKDPPRGQSSSQSIARFTPRRLAKLLADPPEELFYRVFLRVCFDGERKGLPHEPGYTNECPHCGFVFPENPYIPLPTHPFNADKATEKEMIKEWRSEMEGIILKGKAALETQGVTVNRQTFQDVLDASHRRYKVDMPRRQRPLMGQALLMKLAEIEPEPFEGWRVRMANVLERIVRLPPGELDEITVAETYAPLSDYAIETLGEIQRRLGAEASKTLQSLLRSSVPEIVEAVRTYILVPFQRLLVGFNPDSLRVMPSYKLPSDTVEDVQKFLELQTSFIKKLRPLIKGYTAMKLQAARQRLGIILPILQSELRSSLIPGGEIGATYLVSSLILGILGEFLNPNVVPEGLPSAKDAGPLDPTARVPLNLLEMLLTKLSVEGLKYSEEEITRAIAKRNEMENKYFIKRLELPPEEKKMAMRIKRLGLKEWAAGSANVYSLNPEQYERDREQRLAMGIVDFGGDTRLSEAMQRVQMAEQYGGGGFGAEGGYTVMQEAADDF